MTAIRGAIVAGGIAALVAGGCAERKLPPVDIPVAKSSRLYIGDLTCEGRARCITVYLTPWCPACKNSIPFIGELRDYVREHPVYGLNVVVVTMLCPCAELLRVSMKKGYLFFWNLSKQHKYPKGGSLMRSMKMRDYIVRDKKVFIGLEDSKRSWKLCVRSEKMIIHELSMPADYDGLIRYIRRGYPGCTVKLIYEAGFNGFWLHDLLEADGVDCVVTPPNKVTQEKDSRVKNDRIDARRLAKVQGPTMSRVWRQWPGKSADSSTSTVRRSLAARRAYMHIRLGWCQTVMVLYNKEIRPRRPARRDGRRTHPLFSPERASH